MCRRVDVSMIDLSMVDVSMIDGRWSMSRWSMVDESMIDESMIDESMIDESMIDVSVVDVSMSRSLQWLKWPGLRRGMQEKSPLFGFMKLDVYLAAKELAVLVSEANIRDVELRDQATRAAKSAFLNLCEGLPSRSPAMRRK